MPSSIALWAVLSNLIFLAAVRLLYFKGLLARYAVTGVGIAVCVWHSCLYHACYNPEIRYCPGVSPEVMLAQDVMAASLLPVWVALPFVDVWFGGRRSVAIYLYTIVTGTVVLVTYLQDRIPAVAVIGVCAAAVAGWVAWTEYHRREASRWWWVRGGLTCTAALAAVACFVLARFATYNTDTQQLWHAGWHATVALATSFAISLLPDDADIASKRSASVAPTKGKGSYKVASTTVA